MPSGTSIKQSSSDEEDEPLDDQEEEAADEPEEEAGEDRAEKPEEEEGPVLSRRERAEAARARFKPKGRSRYQAFKARFRDWRLPLYAAFFTVSLVLFLLAVFSYVRPEALGPWMHDQFKQLGPYKSWFMIAGVLLILASSYYYLGLIAKRREFNVLIATKSKGDFVRNQDHIERLAFELGSRELEVVAARKKEFRIRH